MEHFEKAFGSIHIAIPYWGSSYKSHLNGPSIFSLDGGPSKTDLEKKPLNEVAAIAQALLFFRLIDSFFGRDSIPKFIEADRNTLTTVKLAELASDWMTNIQQSNEKDRLECRAKCYNNVQVINHQFRDVFPDDADDEPFGMEYSKTMIGIAVIGEFLQAMYNEAFGKDTKAQIHAPWFRYRYEKSFIYVTMRKNGWCPKELKRLYDMMGESAMYYISTLNRPMQRARPSHDSCSQEKCIFDTVDETTYVTKHRNPDCCCGHLKATNEYNLITVLAKGKIPLLLCHMTSDGKKIHSFEFIETTYDTKYVAISHVWSDGLGNPHANTLPQCQLEYLYQVINELYPGVNYSTPFWIDTICCPVTQKNATEERLAAKKKAISLMRATYQNADQVLVLASDLQEQSSRSLEKSELTMRVLCSRWSQRLWTFQEGALPKEGALKFQFKDGAFELESHLDSSFETPYPQPMKLDIKQEFATLRSLDLEFRKSPAPTGRDEASIHPLVFASRALKHRSTSKVEDESLCLGTLSLGTSENFSEKMHRILSSHDKEERMKTFWEVQTNIPSNIVSWRGERLEQKGFRWAPKTFMNPRSPISLNPLKGHAGRHTSKGLLVHFSGCVLDQVPLWIWSKCSEVDGSKSEDPRSATAPEWPQFFFRTEGEPATWFQVHTIPRDIICTGRRVGIDELNHLAIVVTGADTSEGPIITAHGATTYVSTSKILVRIRERDRDTGIIYVSAIMGVSCTAVSKQLAVALEQIDNHLRSSNSGPLGVNLSEKQLRMVGAMLHGVRGTWNGKQQWCFD